MACRFCDRDCYGECFPLHQVERTTFPYIFNPAKPREWQARGWAMTLRMLELMDFDGEPLARLCAQAERIAGRKTIARASELKAAPDIEATARKMASESVQPLKFGSGKKLT